MFPNLGPVVCWNKQWISEVRKKHYDLQKNKQHLSPDSLCGLYGLWINQVLDELECAEPSSRGMQPYGFWAQETFTAVVLNMWTTELFQPGCLCEESAATWQKADWLQCISFMCLSRLAFGTYFYLDSSTTWIVLFLLPWIKERKAALWNQKVTSPSFSKNYLLHLSVLGLVWFFSPRGF